MLLENEELRQCFIICWMGDTNDLARVYSTPVPLADIRRQMDTAMTDAGFERFEPAGEMYRTDSTLEGVDYWQRGDRMVSIFYEVYTGKPAKPLKISLYGR